MTKNEIINEMYNVINNNADVFQYPEKWMTKKYADKVRTTKKVELEQWLAKLNAMVEEAKNAKTVETKVENTENTVEVENNTEKNIEDMTKNEIINKIEKFISNVDYSHYCKFVEGENRVKTPLSCALIGDYGNIYLREFGDSDRVHVKKLKNCTKAILIMTYGVCKLYIDHMNNKLNEAA